MTRSIAVAVLVLFGLSPASNAQSASPDQSREHYAILADKNIFVRNRPPTRTSPRPAGNTRRPEESYALTGVAIQEGRRVAFVENRSTNATQRLLAGASILDGKIVEVGLDSVEFESAGRRIQVRVGRNFLGDVFAASALPATSSTSPTGSTTAPANPGASPVKPDAPLPNDANLSLEERMKLRRQQMAK